MSRTNELRELITSALKNICENVYFEVADEEALYPHIVYYLRSVDLGELSREDYILEIHLWEMDAEATNIEDKADNIVEMFRAENMPQRNILPTFYVYDRKAVDDEDKKIRHRVISVQINMYER